LPSCALLFNHLPYTSLFRSATPPPPPPRKLPIAAPSERPAWPSTLPMNRRFCRPPPTRQRSSGRSTISCTPRRSAPASSAFPSRSEEHTSELQSPDHLVCRP